MRKLVAQRRDLTTRLQKWPQRSGSGVFYAGALVGVERDIAEVKARLPQRQHAGTLAWSSLAFGAYVMAAGILAEASCPPRRLNAASLRFAVQALAALGMARDPRTIEREIVKLRRGMDALLSNYRARQKNPGLFLS